MGGPRGQASAIAGTAEDVAFLRTTAAVRERSRSLYERALRGDSAHFEVKVDRTGEVAAYVARVAREAFPDLDDGPHGRMRHFDAGGEKRVASLADRLAGLDREERARVQIDLVLPSVLLDAGAGDRWAYVDDKGVRHARSEGLAIASWDLFVSGGLSSDAKSLRTDAEGLARIGHDGLARAFQARPENPLVGLEGRARTLARLGVVMRENPRVFGAAARPGHLFDALRETAKEGRVHAGDLVSLLLESLAPIWPGDITVAGENLGDAWFHPALGDDARAVVPFHKLTQWLAYSLVEPLAEGGVEVIGESELTGLAEYRNGGLFLDLGALVLRDPAEAKRSHGCGDEIVVEWRALTVSLLDTIAPRVCALLGRSRDTVRPGALEGMTWAAGRKIASEKREGGTSPLALERDGTVF